MVRPGESLARHENPPPSAARNKYFVLYALMNERED